MPRSAWFLFGGTFVNRFGSFVLVFLVLWVKSKGYSDADAGLAAGSYGVGAIAASGLGGLLSDRIGRRNTIALSMFWSAAAMLALSQASAIGAILALAACAGLGGELYRPASSALLADLVPPERRVTAFALYRFAINVGFAAGPATAGFIAQRSFFLLFVGDAVSSALFGAIALAALPEGRRSAAVHERRGEGLRTMLADRALVVFLASSLLTSFVYLQMTSGLALHTHAAGLSTSDFGLLMAVNGALVTVFELPLTSVTQRLPARAVMTCGQLLIGVGFALTGLAHALPALALTVAVWTLGEMVNAPVAQAYMTGLAPAHMRGRYSGAQSFTWALGAVLGPALGGFLFGLGENVLWLTCLGCGVAAAALIALGPHRAAVHDSEPGARVAEAG